ncbi:hypothetical protein ACMD2_01725 [Ananas comosus]|nr:hypothetical protein ACMD2_01725 [Ananas comosus]
MGNYVTSCSAPNGAAATAALVCADGVLRRVGAHSAVAELMIEAPGHVVARADEVVRTRRAGAMRAEEQLRPREVYLLLPVERAGSRLTDRQVEVLVEAIEGAKRKGKKGKSGGDGRRVFPEVAGKEEEATEENSEREGEFEGRIAGFAGLRVGASRHWRPVLDTIHESN